MQKITVEGNVGGKWSEKKMEGEDGLRTVDCLRGRLLAERVASRNAKGETELLENKLIELEAQLKQEVKSRNRAERRLKFLMKKLESMNISYVSDDSDQSGSLEKSEITSVSSSASSKTKEVEDKEPNTQITNITTKCHIQGSIHTKSSIVPKSLDQNVSKISTSSKRYDSPAEETLSSVSDVSFDELMTPKCHSEKSIEKANSSMASNNFEQNLLGTTTSSQGSGESHSELGSSGYSDDSTTGDHSLKTSNEEEEVNGDNYKGHDQDVDNSMALVPVDLPKMERTIDPVVLDATVKEVLDSLQRAKEKLQISMEQRRMVKVG